MNYQLQQVLIPVKEFRPPAKDGYTEADFSIHHSLRHRRMMVTDYEVVVLEHLVTVMRIPESHPTVELIVQCYYGIGGDLSGNNEGIIDMIGHSFDCLNRVYLALLDTHKLREFAMHVEVGFDSLVEQIKGFDELG